MQLQDLESLFPSNQFEIILDNARQIKNYSVVRLRSVGDSTTVYIDQVHNINESESAIVLNNMEGQFSTKHYADSWRKVQNTCYHAQVLQVTDDRIVIFAIYGLLEKNIGSVLELAITDKQTHNKSGMPLRNVEAVKNKVSNSYVLKIAGEDYLVIAKHINSGDNTFQILNGVSAFSVREYTRRELQGSVDDSENEAGHSSSDLIWAINSSETPFKKSDDYSLEIWKCGIKLSDETSVAKQRAATKAFVDSGLDKYLSVWKQYTEIEHNLVLKIKERAGKLNYTKVEFISGRKYRITLSNPQMLSDFYSCLEGLGNGNKIDITATYIARNGKQKEGSRTATLKRPEVGDSEVQVTMAYDGNTPITGGSIEISSLLSTKQYERRVDAITRIETQNSAKPDLAMLIGGEKAPAAINALQAKSAKLTPLSDSVLQCFGKNQPTETQRTAISIALNTPDFAIIQGPPGTGKTTVINAIMRALAEKESDPQLAYGQNLLTAYQRDTTSHLAEKLRIYGLPTPTYRGGIKGDSSEDDTESDETVRDEAMTSWIEKKRALLQKTNPDIANLEAIDKLISKLNLQKLHFDTNTATLSQTKATIEGILATITECTISEEEAYRSRLSEIKGSSVEELLKNGKAISLKAPISFDVYKKNLNDCLEDVNHRLDTESHELDRLYVNRLPASGAAMSDNGPVVLEAILRRFSSDRYSSHIHKMVEELKTLYGVSPIPYAKIQSRKDILLLSIAGSNWYTIDVSFNEKVFGILDGILKYTEQESVSDEHRLLADYHNAFDVDNDDLLKEWLSDFMMVIAATHQKTVSDAVKTHKGISKAVTGVEESSVEFSNVLIDEAARSCPPDLLIPLACAKDRMILVGDQKQLPQFISDDVYEKIDGYSKSELDELVKTTMFERLISQVAKLESIDHIQRFIQLDEQYRMPQTLGDVVANNFYGGTDKLKSPLGNDDNHTADLPYISGKHLVWLDVIGGRQSNAANGSLTRQSEVDAIVKMLKHMIMTGNEPEKYDYAIITFYSAQRDRIFLAIKNDPYLSEWNRLNKKIKVGTVDAFQGMEADVVFLSLVRSLPKYDRKKNPYGFVSNANRLCVALSRAKRCLVIAGDKEMISGSREQEAKESMPAIEEIYRLCRKEEVQDAYILKNRDLISTAL